LAFTLHKTCALVGMMGAGKTAVGTVLARQIGVPFRDSDAEIETAANMEISEIFQKYGEAFFREREAEVIARLLGARACILSTGGGVFMAAQNRAVIGKRGVSVWLKTDLDLLWSRVRHKDTRPLLQTADPYRTLRDLCEKREPSYQRADLVINSHKDYSLNDMADAVIKKLLTRPDVLESA